MKTTTEITTTLTAHGWQLHANASTEKITQLIFAKQSRRITVMKCSRWPHTSVVVWEQPIIKL